MLFNVYVMGSIQVEVETAEDAIKRARDEFERRLRENLSAFMQAITVEEDTLLNRTDYYDLLNR
ncbi:hypothetical protein SAMN00808754_1655 [Thermanaeromonas toyohensis ToBE]|uniref:Uncharacterized protein n=1 Tax=Thermanaeromonas toyohensis ToBE TaxID=698762 RepID=A0A1W1VTY8_9FIRM|nr:hypothetical protein [Thermanaeromonas toyohensis]SMB96796.1 hypothetical protein SAMN00808754_1655 [Thermanaeromonas toyohensis ToBE]